ncbi:MAG: hypothetical protein EPO08_03700, partial [Rhodospirillaceae bacterium]
AARLHSYQPHVPILDEGVEDPHRVAAAADQKILTAIPSLKNLGHDVRDFADTAALIAALDIVITVDTSVAHLAGALGKPVWVMLPYVPDWRWLLGRSDSPWYPTMRLFRQSAAGVWTDAIAGVAAELNAVLEKKKVELSGI